MSEPSSSIVVRCWLLNNRGGRSRGGEEGRPLCSKRALIHTTKHPPSLWRESKFPACLESWLALEMEVVACSSLTIRCYTLVLTALAPLLSPLSRPPPAQGLPLPHGIGASPSLHSPLSTHKSTPLSPLLTPDLYTTESSTARPADGRVHLSVRPGSWKLNFQREHKALLAARRRRLSSWPALVLPHSREGITNHHLLARPDPRTAAPMLAILFLCRQREEIQVNFGATFRISLV